jgi:hypothetical protein
MQLVGVAEVTVEHEIKLAENIKNKLHPGEKVKIRIESIGEDKERIRLKAIEQMKEISTKSRLGLYDELITRRLSENSN